MKVTLERKILYFLVVLFLLLLWLLFVNLGWPIAYAAALLWIITVVLLLWLGNRLIFALLDKKISWIKKTSRRLFWQLFLSLFYALLCINLTYYLFKISTGSMPPDAEQLFVLNIYGLLFIVPLLSINFGFYFMMQWKKAHIESDLLKEESLNSRLEVLKMHLDPHFLFNNLNVLSALIDQKPAEAQAFLDKFTDVYRYVLQYKKEELVPLQTELDFITAYIFLLEKRFGDQCIFKLDIPAELPNNFFIPPLALQMLVENAVKHNKLSLIRPLVVHIYIEDNQFLVVKNNIILKNATTSADGLRQSGLDNIRNRYQYLSDRQVKVLQDEGYFQVSIPLLELDEEG